MNKQPSLALLFSQLGLANSPAAIELYVRTHQLTANQNLHDAPFWNKSQREVSHDDSQQAGSVRTKVPLEHKKGTEHAKDRSRRSNRRANPALPRRVSRQQHGDISRDC